MIGPIVKSLGRLVRLGQKDEPSAPETERRVWVRYPCDFETLCHPVNGKQLPPISAQVGDISRGGIRLTVGQECKVGGLLTVELGGGGAGEFSTSILAYIVRSHRRAGGEWTLGCTFAAELSNDELQALGGKRVKPRPPDKRTWERFPGGLTITCEAIQESPAERWRARLVDISANGAGLAVSRSVTLGTLLSLEMRPETGRSPLTMLASVVRLTPQGEGTYILGCNFLRELSDKEMSLLLDRAN